MPDRTKIVFDNNHWIPVAEPPEVVTERLSEPGLFAQFQRPDQGVEVYVNVNQIAYLERIPARERAQPKADEPKARKIVAPPPTSAGLRDQPM
jgi:hypothetical protein